MQNPEQFKPQNNEKKNEQEKRASVDRNTRAYLLEKLVLDVAKSYKGEPVPELPSNEKLSENVPISKRTALISDYALSELLTRLSQENDVLNKAIQAGSGGMNVANANEQIKRNNVYIDMIEGNCIKSLDAVADEVLFPKEDSL
ncbi:MAG: hypothetical protein NUV42_00015 [Candidatus Yonathbacteria bacterium]|nr:hypothetical protein [Candidatus Yonathbacteria bacterium]